MKKIMLFNLLCTQGPIQSLWSVHFLSKASAPRAINASFHTTLLWTEKEKRGVFMLMPGMLMKILKMVNTVQEHNFIMKKTTTTKDYGYRRSQERGINKHYLII